MSNTKQIAHVRALENGSYETQPLLDHLHGVAELAQSYAKRITDDPELGEIGYLLGLLHDLGKYQEGFQRYIRQQSGLDPTLSGWRTPHSPAGARYAYNLKQVGGISNYSRFSRSASGRTTEGSTMTPSGEDKLFVLVTPSEQWQT